MRFGLTLAGLLVLSGCTSLLVGGAATGGYPQGQDQRASSVTVADSAITTRIRGQFADDSAFRGVAIGVRTYAGTVTLTGTVATPIVKDQAGRVARTTKGVTAVNNRIVVDD